MSESITLDTLYAEILKNRSVVEASETRLALKIEGINRRTSQLERENRELKKEIERLHRENKRNSIVIFGLNNSSKNLKAGSICTELSNLLEVDLQQTDINDLYTLGKGENKPVKIDLVSYRKKREIFQNCYRLKGKGITIVEDYTPQQREESKLLRQHYLQAKRDGKECRIKANKLYINSSVYTVEDLIEENETENNTTANSEPVTPSSRNATVDKNLGSRNVPKEPKKILSKINTPKRNQSKPSAKETDNPKVTGNPRETARTRQQVQKERTGSVSSNK